MTVVLLALAALAALAAFRRSPEGVASTEGDTSLVRVRRSTSVVLALAESTWTILDALVLVTGRRVSTTNAAQRTPASLIARGGTPPFGSTPADDVN
jgi:hypothetical protein